MGVITLGRALGACVAVLAVLNVVSALSLPEQARKPDAGTVAVWLVLLSIHAVLYWFGDRVRAHFGLRAYAAAQAGILFGTAVAGVPVPVALGLLMTFTVELVLLAGALWGTIPITLGAIALYVAAASVSSSLYQAATAGVLLAVTGALTHAVAALVRGHAVPVVQATRAAVPGSASTPPPAPVTSLSERETEVLRELVRGARNTDIAAALGISERTVKAHLASIYRKLGVESRSAAVAMAVQRRLV